MPFGIVLLAMFLGGYLGYLFAKDDKTLLDKVLGSIALILLVIYYVVVFTLI